MNAAMKLGLSYVFLVCAGALPAYPSTASAQTAPLIKNTGNDRCLAANAMGFAVTQSCDGAAIYPQQWIHINTGVGFLVRNAVTGRCLNNDATGNVFMSACNSAFPSQRWLRQNAGPGTARYKSIGTGLFLKSTSLGAVVSGSFMASPLQIWAY
jgi:hypothetical protein